MEKQGTDLQYIGTDDPKFLVALDEAIYKEISDGLRESDTGQRTLVVAMGVSPLSYLNNLNRPFQVQYVANGGLGPDQLNIQMTSAAWKKVKPYEFFLISEAIVSGTEEVDWYLNEYQGMMSSDESVVVYKYLLTRDGSHSHPQ